MRVLFCKSNQPVSWLIRAVTWSPWFNVAIVDGDEVIEAVWKHGVRMTHLATVIAQHAAHAMGLQQVSCNRTRMA